MSKFCMCFPTIIYYNINMCYTMVYYNRELNILYDNTMPTSIPTTTCIIISQIVNRRL